MKTLRLNEYEFWDAMDNEVWRKEVPRKHDIKTVTSVFEYAGTHYMVSYDCSYEHGVQIYDWPLTAIQVHEVTVTTKRWEPL